MMKRALLLSAYVALAFLFSSCEKEANQNVVETTPEVTRVHFGIDLQNTKTDLLETTTVVWSTGDVISIEGTDNVMHEFTLEGVGGSASGTFACAGDVALKTKATSVYPSSLAPNYQGDEKWHVTVPSEIAWSEDGVKAPMIAWLNGDWNYFVLLGGVIKVDVYNIPATAEQLVFTTDNQKVSGDFALDGNQLSTSSSTTEKTITITFDNDGTLNRTFFIPLPVGTYTNCTIDVQTGAGVSLKKKKASSVSVVKNAISYLPAINCVSGKSSDVMLDSSFDVANWAFNQFRYGSTSVSVGDILHCTFTLDAKVGDEDVTYWQLRISYYYESEWHNDLLLFAMKAGETEAFCELNADMVSKLNSSVALAVSGYGVTVNLIEVLPMPAETVLWKGSMVFSAGTEYISSLSSGSFWNGLKTGSVIGIHYTTPSEWGWIGIKENSTGWPLISGMEFDTPASSNVCYFTLTAAQASAIKTNGAIFVSNSVGLTINKITVR